MDSKKELEMLSNQTLEIGDILAPWDVADLDIKELPEEAIKQTLEKFIEAKDPNNKKIIETIKEVINDSVWPCNYFLVKDCNAVLATPKKPTCSQQGYMLLYYAKPEDNSKQ